MQKTNMLYINQISNHIFGYTYLSSTRLQTYISIYINIILIIYISFIKKYKIPIIFSSSIAIDLNSQNYAYPNFEYIFQKLLHDNTTLHGSVYNIIYVYIYTFHIYSPVYKQEREKKKKR